MNGEPAGSGHDAEAGIAITLRRRRTGALGEDAACAHLTAAGWRILERNARTRYGELDIVAVEGTTLVFVEVKTLRRSNRRGPARPLTAVGRRKRMQVRRLARAWLAERPQAGGWSDIRFDAIGVLLDDDDRVASIEHVRAAF